MEKESGNNFFVDEHSILNEWSAGQCHKYPSCRREDITKIHIYDFDQTLYASPLPNNELYPLSTRHHLTFNISFSSGGWFAEPSFLSASLERRDVSARKRWNMPVTELVKMSVHEPGVLTVLMTGRRERTFATLITHAVGQFCEEFDLNPAFDLVCLKKEGFETTMKFKTSCLNSLLDFYYNVNEVSLYDDRLGHVNQFRKYLTEYVESIRPSMVHTVVHVAPKISVLPADTELKLVLEMIKRNNESEKSEHTDSKSNTFHRYSLSKSLVNCGYRLTVSELSLCQQQIADVLKSEYKIIDLPHGLLWTIPLLPVNPKAPNVMVSTERLHALLPNSSSSDIQSIKKGELTKSSLWKICGIWATNKGGFYGFTLSPLDSLASVYTKTLKFTPVLTIVAPKNNHKYPLKKEDLDQFQDLARFELSNDISLDLFLSTKFQYRLKEI